MVLTFQEFLMRLARGQLKNTSATDDAQDGIIMPKYEEQLLSLTNQGLADIFTRKKLREGASVLTFIPGTNEYSLATGVGEDFEGLVNVLEVINSKDRSFTPKTTGHIRMSDQETIRFSDQFMLDNTPSVEVRFQKLHPVIDLEGSISMPSHLFEALLLYVSGLYLSHMGGEEHTAKGDSYYGLYIRLIMDDMVENRSGTSEVTDDDTRFADRGFV